MREIALSLLLAAAAVPATGAGAAAVLSQVRGEVTVLPSGTGAGHPARSLQLVAAGAVLRLARGAEVVVICAGDRALRRTGPADHPVDPESCAAGRPLAAGTYALLVPAAGRVRDFHGSLLEEAPSRSEDETGKPTLLAPRSTQRGTVTIAEAAPAISWAEVHGALAYEIELERGGGRQIATIEAAGANCGSASHLGRSCTAPWPWPPLAAGEEVALRVRAETTDPDRKIREADPSRLRLADAGMLRAVERDLAALAAADLPAASHQLLRAAVYAEAELFNEAAAALAASLEDRPHPAGAVRLADLYLGLGLERAALGLYQLALQQLPRTGDHDVAAAVHLGLGRLHARRQGSAETAADHLRQAAAFYRRLGWSAEAELAAAEAERAERGLR